MSTTHGSDGGCGESQLHEFRVQGRLEARWAESLQRMTLTLESEGITTLTGPLMDQAALHGLLARIRDLGLPILSYRRLCPDNNPDKKEETA